MEKIDPSLLHLFITEPVYMTPEPGVASMKPASFASITATAAQFDPIPASTRGTSSVTSLGKADAPIPTPSRKVPTLAGHGTMPLPVIANGILLLVHYTTPGTLPSDQALMLNKIAESLNFGPGQHTIEVGDVRRFAIAPGLAGCDAQLVIVIGAPDASIAGMGLVPAQKRYSYGQLDAVAMPSAAEMVADAKLRKALWDQIKGLKR